MIGDTFSRVRRVLTWKRFAVWAAVIGAGGGVISCYYTFKMYRAPARLQIEEEIAIDFMDSIPLDQVPLRVEWDIRLISPQPKWIPLKHLHVVRVVFRNVGGSPFNWRTEELQPFKLRVPGNGIVLLGSAPFSGKSSPLIDVGCKYADNRTAFQVSADCLNVNEEFEVFVYHNSDVSSHLELEGRFRDHPPISFHTMAPQARLNDAPRTPMSLATFLLGVALAIVLLLRRVASFPRRFIFAFGIACFAATEGWLFTFNYPSLNWGAEWIFLYALPYWISLLLLFILLVKIVPRAKKSPIDPAPTN